MRYGFRVCELEEFRVFLSEATQWVQNIVEQIVCLAITSDTKQLSLVFEDIFYQLHRLKSRSLFWGMMDMAMLIYQAESMFKAIRSGRLLIKPDTVDFLQDITNTCETIICELHQAIENLQESEVVEIEIACSQDVECLINFLQQLLKGKSIRAMVLVPQPLVSRLPVVIKPPMIPCDLISPYEIEKSNEHAMDNSSEIINTNHEVVGLGIGTSVTVPDEKVDRLLHFIGELGTAKDMFNKMSSSLIKEYSLPNLSREAEAGGAFIQRIATAMEEMVMSMRRVELGVIFLQFPPIVNNIGSQVGKDIYLAIEGENITVDKIIIKQLSNLLLTIICTMARLSIESLAAREAVGKEPQAHIWLRAYSLGEQIVVEVEDDGGDMKGVDADAKMVEISDLMVSMNEMYHQMDALPGYLEISNLQGKGSKVTITLPPPPLRCTGLLVEISGELFIVPVDNVVEILRVKNEQLVSKRGRQLIYHRGEVLGILSLTEIVGMTAQENQVFISVLVVTNGQEKIGLLVHKLYKEEEIMVKSLPDYLKNIEYIRGAAITRDGKVALVLQVSGLIKKNNLHNYFI